MSHVATTSVVRQLEALFQGGSAAGLSDRQLLERFMASRDEAAFAALVDRHGPMVLGVCRQLLGDAQHAEDAFQATFLVLAQKARSIRDPDVLGNWLYGVATRTARCARQQVARRKRREEAHAMTGPARGSCVSSEPTAPPADRPAIDREQAEALHAEIDRLPASSRLPVVLCYFEGLTIDQAARRLCCPTGTVQSRLVRAREKLRAALARRGVALPAAALGALLAPRSASASVPPLLCETTTRAAIAFAARHAAGGALSAPVAALAQEVLSTMLIHKLKLVTMTVLALAAVATGAGYLALALAGSREGEPPGEPKAQTARTEPRPPRVADAPAHPTLGRMTVTGRVLDPDGKPVKGAVVDLVTQPRSPWVGASEGTREWTMLGQGQSDGDGRYRIDAPRTASTRDLGILALAAAPGHGLGSAYIGPDAEQPTAEIRLQPEQVVRARLVEVTGAPAKGVEVHIQGYSWPNGKGGDGEGGGAWLGANPPKGLRAWPRPIIKTDDQGRIAVTAFGRGGNITLDVRDMRYAREDLHVDTGKVTPSKEVTLVLQPARIIEGRVLAADTGRPIPNAVVSASTMVHNEHARGFFTTKFRADAQGRFIMNPIAGESYTVAAFPTGGEPYLVQQDEVKWTKGAVKMTHDIRLPLGVLIRGKVTEAGTNRPLGASSIQFIPIYGRGGDSVVSGWGNIVASRDDGSFQIAIPPGKGHLLVFGPNHDYVLGEIGSNRLYIDRPGGQRYRAHAIIPYEVKAGDPPHEVATALRPGVTIKGRIEGPDGQTVTDGFVLTTTGIEAYNPHWRGDNRVPVRDGRFELHGLDPEGSTHIYVLDPEHEWGATAEVFGKQAGEDLTIRLQPCGRSKARFVGPDGQPIAKHQAHFEFVMTPGPSYMSQAERDKVQLSADAEFLTNVDHKHYRDLPRTDDKGRFTMVSLIPGALYRINDMSKINDVTKGIQVRKDFTVKPGEAVDLGDLLIEDPKWGAQ
jgi:RNA polymerase sigma factor (sigma-70 family)